MGDKNQGKILKHHEQVNAGKSRKALRQGLRQESFQATQRAWQLRVVFHQFAEAAFLLMWLIVTALLAISSFKVFGNG